MDSERTIRLERLLEVTRNLSTALDLNPFLKTIISEACALTDSEAAAILAYDDTSNELEFLAVPWHYQDALRGVRIPIKGSAAGSVYREAQPLHVPDTKADPKHFSALDFASAFETRSILGVPLMVRGKPLGVLEVVNKIGETHYTEDDTTILENLAAPAALAIHNADLERRIEAGTSEIANLDRLKSDFIAITSHELRTPLGLILGHATFLRELLGAEYHEQIDTIIKNASKLKEIIESLASVDNFQSGAARLRQRAVSMARIIEDVVATFSDLASKRNITLKTDLGRDDLLVEGDSGKIAIALSNLIKNALMFTDEGGHVFVTGELMPGYVKVAVIDDGIGIPAKDLARIFDRFFQVESHLTRRHGGIGLGLSVAKAMIEMHGGRIWAESMEGKGSNFTFLLPVNSDQAQAASRVFLP
ncbi:MAG TPA: ATP-binding protein [Anaerolineales bacterium]|nr:ATP-binding protein [Anaerolineales bacterium]